MALHDEASQTEVEVDRAIERLQSSVLSRQKSGDDEAGNGYITISGQDAEWLLAEITGGREAFAAVVQKKSELVHQVATMRRTIDDLLAMRGKP